MRRSKKWLVGVASAVSIGAIALAPLYVFPRSDDPATTQVDVLFVIGPPTDARMELAQHMVADGHAKNLMVSFDPDNPHTKLARAMCEQPNATTFCHKPVPFTTRGEAQWLSELSGQHGWDSAAIMTFRPHVSRARAIVDRCYDGDLKVINSGEPIGAWSWPYQYAYQTLGYAKVLAHRGC